MATTTPFLGLVKNTGTEKAQVSVLNGNWDAVDTAMSGLDGRVGATGTRLRSFRGLAANIGAVSGPQEGDLYKETDGSKRTWRYDGAAWVYGDTGLVLIKPLQANVVNGTVQADGSIIPTASAKSISFNQLFSTKFREYEIHYFAALSPSDGFGLRLRAGGSDYSAANYSDAASSVSSAGSAVGSVTSGFGYWPLSALTATQHFGRVSLLNPAHSVALGIKAMQAHASNASSISEASRSGSLPGQDTTAFDGFTLYSTSAAGNWDVNASWIKIYALA